jgi:hypothetical protein
MVKPIPPLNVSQSWPPVNYINPEIRSHGGLLAITVVFTTIMVLITSMRLYVRLFMLRTPGWDDLFNLVAAVRISDSMTSAVLTVADLFYWFMYNDEHVYGLRVG